MSLPCPYSFKPMAH